MDLHVILKKPWFFKASAADLTAVLKRILVFSHVAFQKPGLAKSLSAHLAREFASGFSLVVSPYRGCLGTLVCSYVCSLNMANEVFFLGSSKVTQGAFVWFVQDADVAFQLLLLPEFTLAERTAKPGGRLHWWVILNWANGGC